jgi:soluble lytic murein transglycosylase-like protein
MGWNRAYVTHCFVCRRWIQKSGLGGAALLAALIVFFPQASESTPPPTPNPVVVARLAEAAEQKAIDETAAEVRRTEDFLKRHNVGETNRTRIAESIVASSKKHEISPRLLASIVIVESRGNPFAISGQESVGVMQIHVPTWGDAADREQINLFRIEDNVDLGARILKDYVRRFGMSEGIKRYNGFIPGEPAYEESAQRYLTKVREIFDFGDTPKI